MGTYRQPASLVDTQSGKLSRQATKEGFDAIGLIAKASMAQAEKREKKAKETDEAQRRIFEAGALSQGKGNAQLDKFPINAAGIGEGVNNVIKDQVKALIENLELPTSDPRYQENLKIVASTQQFLTGLPAMLEGGVYAEQLMQDSINKGVGYKPNQIAPDSITGAALEANSQTARTNLGWETQFKVDKEGINYGLFTIAKKEGGIVKNAINYIPEDDDDNTQYNFGTYRIVPDATGEVKQVLIADKTFKADGTPSAQYLVKTQETIGNEIYDITRINTDQLLDQSNIAAGVIGEKIIRNGTESMVDYMHSKGILDPNNPDPKGRILGYLPHKIDANGNVVKENGKVLFDKWVQVTDNNGQFVQDATQYKADTAHLSDEQYDKFMQFTQASTAADNGVFAPERRVLDGPATESLIKSKASATAKAAKPGNITEKQRTKNYNKQQINNFYGGLDNKLGSIKSNDFIALKNLQDQLDSEISRLGGADNGTFSFRIIENAGNLGLPAKLNVIKLEGGNETQEGSFELGSKDIDKNFAEMLDRIFVKELDPDPRPTGVPFTDPGGPYSGTQRKPAQTQSISKTQKGKAY